MSEFQMAITPQQFQQLSPDAQATYEGAARKAGATDEQLTSLKVPVGNAAAQVSSNVTVTEVPGSNVAIMGGNGITHAQALAGAKNLLAHGVDKAVVLKAAGAHGINEQELSYEPPSAEAVAAQQRENEVAQGFAPPAKGETYQLQFEKNFAEANGEDDVAALAEINRDFEAAFKHAAVPKVLAQPLLDSFLSTGEKYADISPVAAETRWKEELAMFNKTSRNPEEDNRLAVKGFEALPKAMQEQLAANHAVHSAAARFQLAAFGRALEYRESRKRK
jgi:hypothetical protein